MPENAKKALNDAYDIIDNVLADIYGDLEDEEWHELHDAISDFETYIDYHLNS